MALPLGGTAVMEHAQIAGPPLALVAHLSGYLRKQKPADKGLQHPFEDDATTIATQSEAPTAYTITKLIAATTGPMRKNTERPSSWPRSV